MERADVLAMARGVASKSLGDRTVIGNLKLLNSGGCLKEPQLRHLWAVEAEARGQGRYYAFEAPTFTKFTFKGTHGVSARYDLVLYDDRTHAEANMPSVLLEFKHGLSLTTIYYDLVKVLTENARHGPTNAVLMIVSERIRKGSFNAFFDGLVDKIGEAKAEVGGEQLGSSAWFELLVLVRNTKPNTQPAGLYRAVRGDGSALTFADLWNPSSTIKSEQVDL